MTLSTTSGTASITRSTVVAGGGITYGYDWILSPHWNLETLIGIGYARLWYKQRPNLPCAKCFSNKTENYFGPTKLALTVTYLF